MDDAGLSGPLESGQDAGLEQFSDWLHASMDEHVGDAFSSDLPRSSHMYNEATRIGPRVTRCASGQWTTAELLRENYSCV